MTSILKRALRRPIGALGRIVAAELSHQAHASRQAIEKQSQLALTSQWRTILHNGAPTPALQDVQFGAYSQNGEDGILLFIFCAIGTTDKTVIEICAGNGIECNAANLIVNWGWRGFLFDGDPENVRQGTAFYSRWGSNTWRFRREPPIFVPAWVTAENVNELVSSHITGDVDLVSIDIDGMDFWVWKSLTAVRPRVVVIEYNNRFPSEVSATVPYDPKFQATDVMTVGYFGASLAALAKLGAEKGYRLIGSNGPNTNAFFMRNDTGLDIFPEVTVQSCLSSDHSIKRQNTQYRLIRERPLTFY
jgi:hypothetical protein